MRTAEVELVYTPIFRKRLNPRNHVRLLLSFPFHLITEMIVKILLYSCVISSVHICSDRKLSDFAHENNVKFLNQIPGILQPPVSHPNNGVLGLNRAL